MKIYISLASAWFKRIKEQNMSQIIHSCPAAESKQPKGFVI